MSRRSSRRAAPSVETAKCLICSEQVETKDDGVIAHLALHSSCAKESTKTALIVDGTSMIRFNTSAKTCGSDYLYGKSVVGRFFCPECQASGDGTNAKRKRAEKEAKEEKGAAKSKSKSGGKVRVKKAK